ncbi:HU family DNA-binding protein [Oceanicola sp. D3]|uniref:HU family DNA-binding protein n=1 Tax=Oceanicola sp. D3 TaxID=2587163 RepID=UPI00143D8807|nr:HU family DNA-binding protein [Oceanicola sp. D3]
MKLVEPAPKPEITVVTPAEPVVAEGIVKKVELVARVVEATGLKRKDVKPVVEATLQEVNRIIGEGSNLQLPELGKLMIHKRKDVPNGEMVMLKLRRKTAQKPLAESDDNG